MDYIKFEKNLEKEMQDPALRHLLRERKESFFSKKYDDHQLVHIDEFLPMKAPAIAPCVTTIKPIGDGDFIIKRSSIVQHACGFMDLLGKKYSDVRDVEPQFFDLMRDSMTQAIAENKAIGIQHYSYRANYVKVWEELIIPFESDDGPIAAVIGKPIVLANKVLETALDAVADSVVTVLPLYQDNDIAKRIEDFIIISANAKFCDLFSFLPGSLKGMQLSKALPHIRDTPLWDITLAAIETKEQQHRKMPLQHNDETFHVEMTVSPISGGVTITMADQSLIVSASEAERQKTAELEKYAQNLESTQIAYREELMRRRELEQRLRYLAETDVMTGLHNRRKFLDKAENEVSRSKRYSRVLSMLMMDIDLFKTVNDKYGHAAGDAVIEMVGHLCSNNIRENIDFAGRLGGEEFAILLPECNIDNAILLAERLRASIEETIVEVDDTHISVTVSIGVAEIQQDENASDLVRRSDDALYASKSAGRNQVQIAA